MSKKIPSDSFQFEVIEKDGKKGPRLLSEMYWRHFFQTKTKVGDKGTIHITLKKPTRSEAQLNYYFVICTLIGNHSGYTKEEVHSALVIEKWGVKEVKIGKITQKVRKSVSDGSKLSMTLMNELIDLALDVASFEEITVPTKEELGYISNY